MNRAFGKTGGGKAKARQASAVACADNHVVTKSHHRGGRDHLGENPSCHAAFVLMGGLVGKGAQKGGGRARGVQEGRKRGITEP